MNQPFPLVRLAFLFGGVFLLLGFFAGFVDGTWPERDKKDKDKDKPKAEAPAKQVASADSGAQDGVCRVDTSGIALPGEVREASGLAVAATGSRFWTHNDSGTPDLYLVERDGSLHARVRLTGAEVVDWEDVAAGPCPEGNRCLFVADIGDNDASRPEIVVYRVPEPAANDSVSAAAQPLRARYPDGAHDAEALFVTPAGRVYVVTKGETGSVGVYAFPERPVAGQVSTLERVRELAGARLAREERITGAAASPDGQWVALRSLWSLSFYPAAALTTNEALPSPDRFALPRDLEPQGEGIAWGRDGVYLSSEGGSKKQPGVLTRLQCEPS